MNYYQEEIVSREGISITSLLPEIGPGEVQREILAGLLRKDKYISSKFFYNQKGSELFEEITRLEEYYPTRTEMGLLERIAPALMGRLPGHDIIELGAGDPSKASILIHAALACGPVRYLPLDISQVALKNSARALTERFPGVEIEGYVLDFLSQFEVLDRDRPQLVCFLGSTIGNFEVETARNLLRGMGSHMKPGDTLLLGMDLVKGERELHAAYNDARGVTRDFNLNILHSVNDLIASDFDPMDFDHLAFYREEKQRIEMHLVARRELQVRSPLLEAPLEIAQGEHIHTENSHKYREKDIHEMARAAGLQVVQVHMDERRRFALSEFRK